MSVGDPRFLRAGARRALGVALSIGVVGVGAGAACDAGQPAAPHVGPAATVSVARAPNRCIVPERTRGIARLVRWRPDATFYAPVEMVPHPADGALYLAEMTGRVLRVVDGQEPRLVLDMRGKMNEGGMRAFAFHPSGARAFAVVERPPIAEPGDGPHAFEGEVLSFSVLPSGDLDPTSEALVLRVHIPRGAHGVDTLRFGPDGNLYVSVGDGRTSFVSSPPAYDPSRLLGAILRLDVEQAPYAIPPDNPFVGIAGRREEVYAYGFRNPWKVLVRSERPALGR